VQIMASCTYHGQNDKRRRLSYSDAPSLDSITKNRESCRRSYNQSHYNFFRRRYSERTPRKASMGHPRIGIVSSNEVFFIGQNKLHSHCAGFSESEQGCEDMAIVNT
jgi:hypothetical protein